MKKIVINNNMKLKKIRIVISLLIGVILIVWQIIDSVAEQNFNDKLLELKNSKAYLDYYPLSVFNSSILNSNFSMASRMFFYILPFIVSFPYATLLYDEKEKTDNIKYCLKKYIRAFVGGATIGLILIVLNFILISMFIPTVKPDIFCGYFPIVNCTMGSVYLNHPLIYTIIYSLIDILYCGLFSVITITYSYLCKYKISVLSFPIVGTLVFQYFCYYLPELRRYSPFLFLRQDQYYYNLDIKVVFFEFVFIVIILVLVNLIRLLSIRKN